MGDFNVNTLNEINNTSTHMHDFKNICLLIIIIH